MSDYHIAKHVMGELTFGEYWNLIGCNAAVVAIKNRGIPSKTGLYKTKKTFSFSAMDKEVWFSFGRQGREDEEPIWRVKVPFESKVKVDGNSVRTFDSSNKEVTLEFYDLVPVPGLMP